MHITIDIDTRQIVAETLRQAKKLAYGTTQAINATLKDIQVEERAELDRRFVIRKNRFMYSLIKISRFAKVFTGTGPQLVYGEIEIDATKTRVLLQEFTEGGYKDPAFGKHVAVPITGSAARPSFSDPVTAALMISRLDFHQHVTATGKVQWEGSRRTFIVPNVGIFQRSGGGNRRPRADRFLGKRQSGGKDDGTELLYKFVTRPSLRRRYEFAEIAQRVVEERWDRNFDIAYGPE